jgi:hypothetical protein
MEKLVYALWRSESASVDELSCSLRDTLAPELVDIGAGAVQVNIADAVAGDGALRHTTFDAPVDAVVSVWVPDAEANAAAVTHRLEPVSSRLAGWLVNEHVAAEPPAWPEDERSPGLANVVFLRHLPSAVEASDSAGCVHNTVVRAVTAAAPAVDLIVEELFPQAAPDGCVEASLAALGVPADLADVDVVPTSRYVHGSTYRL